MNGPIINEINIHTQKFAQGNISLLRCIGICLGFKERGKPEWLENLAA